MIAFDALLILFRYEFTLEENDEEQCFIVDVSCPK